MWRPPAAKIRLALVAMASVVFVSFSAWFINKYFAGQLEASLEPAIERLWPTPTPEQTDVQQLRKIAGWFSLDCGHVHYSFGERDRAVACVQEALRRRRRFYVAFDWVGWDSTGATGFASGWGGAVYEVETNALGGRGRVSVYVGRCERPPVEKTVDRHRYLTCPLGAAVE